MRAWGLLWNGKSVVRTQVAQVFIDAPRRINWRQWNRQRVIWMHPAGVLINPIARIDRRGWPLRLRKRVVRTQVT
jgi:hypothetical protein